MTSHMSVKDVNVVYVQMYMCFNSSKIAGSTNIKLGMMNHHSKVSVIRVWQRHDDVATEDEFFKTRIF